MKRIILFLSACAFSFILNAQNKHRLILLKKAEDINIIPDSARIIKDIRRLYKTNSLLVIMSNNKKIIMDNKMVWGILYPDNVIYRNYNNDFFEIEQAGELVIYSRRSKGFRGRQLINYYFSKNYNSLLLPLNKMYIESQYSDNLCGLNKIKQTFKWPRDYTARNKNGMFKLLRIINECNMVY